MLLGWVEKGTGLRRFRAAYIERPRKNAKSTDAAVTGLSCLVDDGEFGGEVYSGATSEKQAWEVFRPAKQMAERTPEFLEGLDDPQFVERFLRRSVTPGSTAPHPKAPGSTTHIAVLDREGWACSVTCSNGSCSGVVVPGTGVHLNNMLGEQDLNPLGFHRHPPGRRLLPHPPGHLARIRKK